VKKDRFLKHIAQTSAHPFLLEIEHAEGVYIYDTKGKKYLDLIAGISVLNVGHRHPKVVEAIKKQADKYLHVMVYGEYLQSPQIDFAEAILEKLPENLNNIYFTNSGTESIEAACKLAKRYTQKSELCYFKGSYHGSTQGSLSLYGHETAKQNYRPLLPNTRQLIFNDFKCLDQISDQVAAVVVEPVQAATGLNIAQKEWLLAVHARCKEKGALLIFDEIQSGFGRTGKLFAFERLGVVPDVLCIAKGMGSGLPIGGLVADKKIMQVFKNNPILGHITTFGGNWFLIDTHKMRLAPPLIISEEEIEFGCQVILEVLDTVV